MLAPLMAVSIAFPMVIVAGLDHRFGWSPVFPLWLIVIGFIVVYQQIENYFFAPRITARTMELHPAVAFGAALAGASLLGFVGAILALPGAAMLQAISSVSRNDAERTPTKMRKGMCLPVAPRAVPGILAIPLVRVA